MKTIIILALCAAAIFAFRLPFKPSKHTSGRIIGSKDAAPGQFPYIAAFHSADSHSDLCGASLLNENYAITVGQCCDRKQASDMVIVAGTNKLEGDEGNKTYPIEEIILHPNYTYIPTDLENDICLLRLGAKAEETDLIKFIALNRDIDDSAKPAEIAGWGEPKDAPGYSRDLRWLATKLVAYDDCIEAYGTWGYYPIRTTQVCALARFGQGACVGDAGDPLVVYDKDGNPLLTGLVSWGVPCGLGFPDVHTKVASYIDWIDSIINN